MGLKIYGSEGYLVSVNFWIAVGLKRKSRRIHDSNAPGPHGRRQLTRVNSAHVQDEGLRIGGIGRRMNSKVKISQTRRVSRINVVVNLAYSQSVPGRPLLAPIYRWPFLKEPVGFNTYLRCLYMTLTHISTMTILGPNLTGLRGTQITGFISYTLVRDRGWNYKRVGMRSHGEG
jgi:hypothetical protein